MRARVLRGIAVRLGAPWVVAASLACAESPGSAEGVDAGPPVALEAIVPTLVDALCDGIARCAPTFREDAETVLMLGGPEDCRRRLGRLFVGHTTSTGNDFADLARAVRAGTVLYDPAGARRCMNRVASRCAVRALESELCFEAFSGTVRVGGSCWRSEECAGDAWCDHGALDGRTCPGSCRPRTARGAACTLDRECSRAGVLGVARCGSDAAGMRCVDERVGGTIALGQRCSDFAAGTDPTVQVRVACAAGLLCAIPAGSLGGAVCVALSAEGAACDPTGAECAATHECSGRPARCRPLPVRHRAGEACDAMGASGVCNVFEGLRCVMDRCAAYGDGSRGSACATDDLPSCRAGLYCDRMARTCQPVANAGAACTRSLHCASGQCEMATCRPRMCR